MKEDDLVKTMMEVFTFLEDKDIYYPENIHVLECLLSWFKLGVKQIELKDK